jgi:AAHS family 4-hydroxybenzoate transporter-like MFS transporter
VIAVAAFVWLPDSIRFLLVKGGADDRVRSHLARIAPGVSLPQTLSAGPDESRPQGAFAVTQLFAARRATGTILIWVVYFMNLLNLYFLNSWLPTIISDANVPVATAIRLTALFQIGGIGGALVLGALLDRVFSFWILAGCYLWAAVCVFFIGAASGSTLMLGLTIASAGLGIIGGQNACHALTASFYPVTIRSTGVGWALGIGRIGSIVGPVLGGLLVARGTPIGRVFWAAAIPALIATLAAAGIASLTRGDPK